MLKKKTFFLMPSVIGILLTVCIIATSCNNAETKKEATEETASTRPVKTPTAPAVKMDTASTRPVKTPTTPTQ